MRLARLGDGPAQQPDRPGRPDVLAAGQDRPPLSAPSAKRHLGEVFDRVADAYDEARPGYPGSVVDVALERGGLHPGSRVLEIGCGTGKLTELLVARDLIVDAVDPGPNMIEAARRRVGDAGNVRFHVGRFEDLRLPESSFEAVLSATAFHWVDPQVAWRKAAALLVPGGSLALLTYTGLRDERSAPAEEGFAELLRKHAPEIAPRHRPALDLAAIHAGIDARRGNVSEVWDWVMGEGRHELAVDAARDLFDEVEVAIEVADAERTTDQILAHFRTTSLWFQIDPGRRQAFEEDDRRLLERLGGTLHFSWATVLVTARKR